MLVVVPAISFCFACGFSSLYKHIMRRSSSVRTLRGRECPVGALREEEFEDGEVEIKLEAVEIGGPESANVDCVLSAPGPRCDGLMSGIESCAQDTGKPQDDGEHAKLVFSGSENGYCPVIYGACMKSLSSKAFASVSIVAACSFE